MNQPSPERDAGRAGARLRSQRRRRMVAAAAAVAGHLVVLLVFLGSLPKPLRTLEPNAMTVNLVTLPPRGRCAEACRGTAMRRRAARGPAAAG